MKKLTMVLDYSSRCPMETMAISKFKATCLATLERVRVTGRPLRVTRFGKAVAEIVPPTPEAAKADWIGSMKGTLKVNGDLLAPTSDLAQWDVLR